MAKQLYDIQGVPIKVGSLVAYATSNGFVKARVTKLYSTSVQTDGPGFPHHLFCVVLEEPVWPNS